MYLRLAPALEDALLRFDQRYRFPIVVWKDTRSGELIPVRRKDDVNVLCRDLQRRANILVRGKQAGLLTPRPYVRRHALAVLVIVPSVLFFPLTYVAQLAWRQVRGKGKKEFEGRSESTPPPERANQKQPGAEASLEGGAGTFRRAADEHGKATAPIPTAELGRASESQPADHRAVDVKRHVLQFAAAWLVSAALLAIVIQVVNVEGGVWVSVPMLIAASFFAAARFAKEVKRAPTVQELGQFASWAVVANLMLSIAIIAILFAMGATPSQHQALGRALTSPLFLSMAAVGLGLAMLIHFFLIKWCFGWYANRALKRPAADAAAGDAQAGVRGQGPRAAARAVGERGGQSRDAHGAAVHALAGAGDASRVGAAAVGRPEERIGMPKKAFDEQSRSKQARDVAAQDVAAAPTPTDPAAEALARAIREQSESDPLVGAKAAAEEIFQRLLAAMKTDRGVHVESLLCALGALAGYACQANLRAQAVAKGLPETAAFMTVKGADGKNYFFGDPLNEALVQSQYSVWTLAAGAAQNAGATALLDIHEIFAHTAQVVGGEQFGVPRLPENYRPADLPINYLAKLWPALFPIVKLLCPTPVDWPIAYSLAIHKAIEAGKGVIHPEVALSIVMEAAVPMSKVELG
jgi:hypothetical protein